MKWDVLHDVDYHAATFVAGPLMLQVSRSFSHYRFYIWLGSRTLLHA